MKVALVHDWLTGMRGGEKVLLSLARLFPDAPIFTLLHVPGSCRPELEAREIRTTFVQHLPGVERRYRHYLPLFPAAAASIDLSRLRPRRLQLALRGEGRAAPRRERSTSATATRRCATSGTAIDDYFGPGRVLAPRRLA